MPTLRSISTGQTYTAAAPQVPHCDPVSASCGKDRDFIPGPPSQYCGEEWYTPTPITVEEHDATGGKLWHARVYWDVRYTTCYKANIIATDCSDNAGNYVYSSSVTACGAPKIFNDGAGAPYNYTTSPDNFTITFGFHGFGSNSPHYMNLNFDTYGNVEVLYK